MMKAIIQTGAQAVETQELERPAVGPDEVLVKVHSAGVCGSDAHAFEYDSGYEWIQIPRIMGHEYAGEVVETGADVDGFSEGDKIIEEPIHNCGDCFQCKNGQPNVCQNFSITGMHRDGAYAEYVAVDPAFLHAVPDDVPLHHAAITEPTSIATRAVLDQSVTKPGDNVLVEGPGPIGVLVAAVADSLGANVVVSGLGQDAAYRLPLLEDLDIETINVQVDDIEERTETTTDGRGFDVVFDSTGHHSGIGTAVEYTRKGGQVVVVGIPNEASELTLTSMVRGEIDVNTSYGSTWTNFEQALRLMERGEIPVDEIIDSSYGTDDPSAAFEAFLDGETCKPVFQFSA
jgi:L-iditol 2-dehydrogenase